MAEGWKPCPACGYESHPLILDGESYRYRRTVCKACEWGLEIRVSYGDDPLTIERQCRDEWNDRRTWEERTNG